MRFCTTVRFCYLVIWWSWVVVIETSSKGFLQPTFSKPWTRLLLIVNFDALMFNQVSGVAFDSYWSSPNSNDNEETVRYRFGSVGQVLRQLFSLFIIHFSVSYCSFGSTFWLWFAPDFFPPFISWWRDWQFWKYISVSHCRSWLIASCGYVVMLWKNSVQTWFSSMDFVMASKN